MASGHLAPVIRLTETSPPQSSPCPVTVAELRAHLRLPQYSPPVTDEDSRLQMLLDAAWDEAAGRQNRDLTPLQWDLTVYPPYDAEIQLRADTATIDTVTAYDHDGQSAVVDPATYYLDDARSRLVWLTVPPAGRHLVIRHTTRGLSPLPDYLHAGVLLLAGYWWQLGWPVYVGTGESTRPREYPLSISHLLSRGAFPCACPR